MEYGVIHTEINDRDIKPVEALRNYFSKVEKDTIKFFPKENLQATACPSCKSTNTSTAFTKNTFDFVHCEGCFTLYTTKVPTQGDLESFFRKSEAREFWLKEIWPQTSAQRKTKIIEPLLTWIQNTLEENIPNKKLRVGDLYPSNPGTVEVAKNYGFTEFASLDPWYPNAVNSISFQTSKGWDALLINDALGRVNNPKQLLKDAAEKINSGGYCFITCLLSTGLDVLTLGEKSSLTMPPDHLFLPSYEGLLKMFDGLPFEVQEFSTPGVLDVQHLKSSTNLPAFFKYAFERRKDSEFENALQDLLQEYRFSSQARIALKRK